MTNSPEIESIIEQAIAYAKEREQFGSALMKFQGVSFVLADMATELEAARLLVLQAAFLRDKGEPYTMQASMAKLKATDACMKITTDAVQLLGGYGYIEEFKVERLMREVVEKLKPRYRTLVELRYFKEYSYEEISVELDLPLGTVKAQLFRAREFLYNIMKNSEGKI